MKQTSTLTRATDTSSTSGVSNIIVLMSSIDEDTNSASEREDSESNDSNSDTDSGSEWKDDDSTNSTDSNSDTYSILNDNTNSTSEWENDDSADSNSDTNTSTPLDDPQSTHPTIHLRNTRNPHIKQERRRFFLINSILSQALSAETYSTLDWTQIAKEANLDGTESIAKQKAQHILWRTWKSMHGGRTFAQDELPNGELSNKNIHILLAIIDDISNSSKENTHASGHRPKARWTRIAAALGYSHERMVRKTLVRLWGKYLEITRPGDRDSEQLRSRGEKMDEYAEELLRFDDEEDDEEEDSGMSEGGGRECTSDADVMEVERGVEEMDLTG